MQSKYKADTAYEKQISLVELHENFCFHMDRLYSSVYKPSSLHKLKNYGRVACQKLNLYVDPKRCIFDIFEDENILDYIDGFKKHTETNQSKPTQHKYARVLNFVLDEVIAFRGTDHWLSTSILDSSNFDENLSPVERFLFCISKAAQIIKITYPLSTITSHNKHLVNKVNDMCGGIYFTHPTLRRYITEKSMPIWVEDDPSKDENYYRYKSVKPISVAKAIEKLAQAPVGYLVDSLIISSDITCSRERKKSKRTTIEKFDLSLINSTFREELKLYAEYKTDAIHNTNRNKRWVVRPQKNKKYLKRKTIMEGTLNCELATLRSDQIIPSFQLFINNIILLCRHALKFKLLKPEELSLYRISQVDIVSEVYKRLLNEKQRTTGRSQSVISSMSSLWFTPSSFFLEYADLFCSRYNISKDKLVEKTELDSIQYKKLGSNLASFIEVSEHSHNLLNEDVLKLDNPSDYIFNILANAKKDLEIRLNSRVNMSHMTAYIVRDICLVSCLLNCPLRARNWIDMKLGYHVNDECIFWNETKKCYVLSIPKAQFKNYTQKSIPKVFQTDIQSCFTEAITNYIDNARPILLKGATSDKFFITKVTDTAAAINKIVKTFTARYDDKNLRIGGINIHCFRAIVATTFLKKFKGSFAYAAFLLLDSEETVRAHYGHLSPDDAFMEWGKIITTDKGVSA